MLNHSGCALDLDLREILHTMYDKENKIQFRMKNWISSVSWCLWIFFFNFEWTCFKNWGDEYWKYLNFVLFVKCWILVLYRMCVKMGFIGIYIYRGILLNCVHSILSLETTQFFLNIKSCYTVHLHVAAKK